MVSPSVNSAAPIGPQRLKFQLLDAALSLTPAALRRAMGWWRWSDVLEGGRYPRHLKRRIRSLKAESDPAAELLRRGLLPPAEVDPWPSVLGDPDRRFGRTVTQWDRLDAGAVAAWTAVWRAHPRGQACLDRALVVSLANGWSEAGEVLLAAGADPLAEPLPGADKNVVTVYWDTFAGRSFAARLEGWRKLVHVCPGLAVHGWERWRVTKGAGSWPTRYLHSESELESWRASGLPMPQGEVALQHALWAMRANPVPFPGDPPLPARPLKRWEALQTVRWWKRHGALPAHAETRLLAEWLQLQTLDAPLMDTAVEAWTAELLPERLPPRPAVGPKQDGSVPWSHWALAGAHFAQLPAWAFARLFSEPDAFTARDRRGHTALDILESRTQGSANRDHLRVRAWVEARRLEETLPAHSSPERMASPGARSGAPRPHRTRL